MRCFRPYRRHPCFGGPAAEDRSRLRRSTSSSSCSYRWIADSRVTREVLPAGIPSWSMRWALQTGPTIGLESGRTPSGSSSKLASSSSTSCPEWSRSFRGRIGQFPRVRPAQPPVVPFGLALRGRGGTADAHGSGPCGGNPVEVQLLSPAPAMTSGSVPRDGAAFVCGPKSQRPAIPRAEDGHVR